MEAGSVSSVYRWRDIVGRIDNSVVMVPLDYQNLIIDHSYIGITLPVTSDRDLSLQSYVLKLQKHADQLFTETEAFVRLLFHSLGINRLVDRSVFMQLILIVRNSARKVNIIGQFLYQTEEKTPLKGEFCLFINKFQDLLQQYETVFHLISLEAFTIFMKISFFVPSSAITML